MSMRYFRAYLTSVKLILATAIAAFVRTHHQLIESDFGQQQQTVLRPLEERCKRKFFAKSGIPLQTVYVPGCLKKKSERLI